MASTRLLAHAPGGRKRHITVEIGRSYALKVGGAACPMAIVGLFERLADIHGEDTVQALALAVKVARSLLASHVKKSGRLTYPDGTEIDLAAHFGA